MKEISIDLNGFIYKYVFSQIRNLNSGFFEILEDLKNDEYINEEIYARVRKKWLDKSNIVLRALDDQLREVDFSLKSNK